MKKSSLTFTAAALLLTLPLLTACGDEQQAKTTPANTTNTPNTQSATITPPPTGGFIPPSNNGIQAEENAPLPTPNPNEKIQIGDAQWISIEPNVKELKTLQASADQGHATAYMTPESAAREFVGRGFVSQPQIELEPFKTGAVKTDQWESDSIIKITKDDKTLVLRLHQPEKQGNGGIWIVNAMFTVEHLQMNGQPKF